MSGASSMPPAAELAVCALCPKLCRHVCPVAVATGHEAAAPSNMAQHPWRFLRGSGTAELALQAASLCVECGACTAQCELHEPLGVRLAAVRHALSAPAWPQPLGAVEGEGRHVAVEADSRRWAEALARHLGEPVARLRTEDHLGAEALAGPLGAPAHVAALRALLSGRVVVVADHRSLAAVQAAGLQGVHLAELAPPPGAGPVFHPCKGPRLAGEAAPEALACCGAGTALESAHPALAATLRTEQARRLGEHAAGGDTSPGQAPPAPVPTRCPDASCGRTLAQAGLLVLDPVDALLAPSS